MAKLLWTVFGLGLLPRAPGTFGTLAGVAIAVGALQLPQTNLVILGAAVVVTLAAVPLARAAEAATGKKDPQSFVLDEVAGYLVAILGLPIASHPWLIVLAGFALFRLFDILKPPPIRRLEKGPGGIGVVADDLMAGVYANVCLHIIVKVFLQ